MEEEVEVGEEEEEEEEHETDEEDDEDMDEPVGALQAAVNKRTQCGTKRKSNAMKVVANNAKRAMKVVARKRMRKPTIS